MARRYNSLIQSWINRWLLKKINKAGNFFLSVGVAGSTSKNFQSHIGSFKPIMIHLYVLLLLITSPENMNQMCIGQ